MPGMYLDRGRPIVGGWLGGGWAFYDPGSGRSLLWCSEHGQEGAVLFAIDLATGEKVHDFDVPTREVADATQDPVSGDVYFAPVHGIYEPGHTLWRYRAGSDQLESCGFGAVPLNRFRTIAWGDPGWVWAGTHPGGHLMAYDPKGDDWHEFGALAPPPIVPGQQIWLSPRPLLKGKVLCGIVRDRGEQVLFDLASGTSNQVEHFPYPGLLVGRDRMYSNSEAGIDVIDADLSRVETLTWADLAGSGSLGSVTSSPPRVSHVDGQGNLWGRIGSRLLRIDPREHTVSSPAELTMGGSLHVLLNGDAVVADVQKQVYEVYDSAAGEVRRGSYHYEGRVATDIVGLNKGPDGDIYGSTIISMHLFRYRRKEQKLEDLGRVGWGSGEIYDVIAYEDRLYLGSYTGAYWAVYDPQKPWQANPDSEGMADDSNPRNFGQLGEDTNRPFEYAVGPDGRIYIACRSNYGKPGGALVAWDPRSETKEVFRDIDQSIQCVAADDRYVYGGTSIHGGRGWAETTTVGRVFAFDCRRKHRAAELMPHPHAIAVTSLAVSRDTKLVYGVTDNGFLFVFDPVRRDIVGRQKLRSLGTPLMGVPEGHGVIHLTAASDGNIYGVTQTDLFQFDVHTERVNYLKPPPIPDCYQIVEAEPGVFYVGARGHLLEFHLSAGAHYR